GVETFISTGGGVRGINLTEDIGGLPGDFEFVMGGRIGPFLIWDPAESPPPAGFVGDPTIPHTVLGSPFGTNVFRIEGPDVGGPGVDIIETNLFFVMGKTNALDSTPICLNDADCDDGVFCNGIETCVNGVCQPGTPFNCTALDIDGDGDFSGADVNAMIDVLLDAPQAPEHVFRADTNGDGLNNGEDLQPFLDAMFGM
ncbi:MAG: hypothetical protein ACE5EC_03290, partial [Phycisphaerae bacterium]